MSAQAAQQSAGEPGSLRLAFTLGIGGLLSGLVLVGIYEITLPVIKANKAAALQAAVFEVVPGSSALQKLVPAGDGWEAVPQDDEREGVFAAFGEGGRLAGFAIPSEGSGFQDKIQLIYGFDADRGRMVGMRVLESRETPGLGDKIIKDAEFVANFDDLVVKPTIRLMKKGEKSAPNEVDAITGATISSRAIVKILNTSVETWVSKLPARSVVEAKKGGG